MRIFRRPNYRFSLPYRMCTPVGNATKVTLSDCEIMIPTVWIKDRKMDKHGKRIMISEYWAREIAVKIRTAGGNPMKYKSLQSARR